MTSRREIIAEPLTVYRQTFTGTLPTVPGPELTPAAVVSAGWDLIGRYGAGSMKREGVKVMTSPEFGQFIAANGVKVSDRWLTGEDAEISFMLVDLQLEVAALLFDQTVTATSGTPDTKEIGFGRPLDLRRHSLLLRGRTPYSETRADDRNRQLVLWDCVCTSGYEEMANLENPGEIPLMFKPSAVESEPEITRYGRLLYWAGP